MFKTKIQQLTKIYLGEVCVISTYDHRFYSSYKIWKPISEFGKKEKVMIWKTVLLNPMAFSSETKISDTSITVYNITVDDNHNYFVSKKDILVHNRK